MNGMIHIKTYSFSVFLALALSSFNVSAFESGVEGSQTNANRTVNSSTVWTVLSSSAINIPAGTPWHCVAVGSADVINAADGIIGKQYRFTLTIDSTNPATNGACERTLDIADNNSVADGQVKNISSNCTFKSIAPGVHTIYWLSKKVNNLDPDATVDDNSLSVVCSDNVL